MGFTNSVSDTIADVKYRYIAVIVATFSLIGVLEYSLTKVVSAQEGTQPESMSERCVLAQNYLKNIQKPRDLRARVDRLQAYQYTAQRLNVFIQRLERNEQPEATNLRDNLDRFNTSIKLFKDTYESYDQARESVVKVEDCKNNYDEFSDKLTAAREKRALVSQSIELIQSILGTNVKSQLESLYQQLLISGKSGVSNE